jgi:ribosomal protein S18 acetylase RimI-like enzyme
MSHAGAVRVVPLTSAVLDDVVRIHRAGLGYTLNSQLGANHMRFLYQTMAADSACFVGVALLADRPAGVVSGSLDVGSFMTRLLRAMPAYRLGRIAVQMLLHPRLIWLWRVGAQVASPVRIDSTEVKAILTAIAVDPKVQGKGIGKELVRAFEGFLRQSGVRAYKLDTQIRNERASDFYNELGFEEVDRRADSIVFIRRLD